MRRFARILTVFLLCFALASSVMAASSASDVKSYSTVSMDGSCQVTLNLTLQLDGNEGTVRFPIPREAKSITVNGSAAGSRRSGDVKEVKLTGFGGGQAGTFSLSLHYILPNTVTTTEEGKLLLELPLLSGFSYPIEQMEFTVTLPGAVTGSPAFSSGYHKSSIESYLTFEVKDATISGIVTSQLKDHETMAMTLEVTPEMFPQAQAYAASTTWAYIAMGVCAGLALVYWIATLRFLPPLPVRQATAPDGISAGELGCTLTAQGVDLTMMVLSWAQLGYLLIQLDDNGRVFLHKRMDMGNERSSFENKIFRSLFSKKRMVDGTGYHYARLCRSVARSVPGGRNNFLPASGNPKLFRVLAAGIGLFGGMAVATALARSAALQVVLMILLGALAAVSCWFIQAGCGIVQLRGREKALPGAVCCVIWLILGAASGMIAVALIVIGSQLIAGFGAAYGGRRSDTGRQAMAQIAGLRRHMRKVSPQELQRICQSNPDYFHQLAPYALALEVDKTFAKRFGRMSIPKCSYLIAPTSPHMTAMEWSRLLRDAAAALDERQKLLPFERFIGR